MSVTVTTQAELDAALARGEAEIIIDSPAGVWLQVSATDSSSVVAYGSSSVVARDSSRVAAWGSSRVEAWDSSRVVARDSSRVEARDSSRVVAYGSSSVEAWDSSRVVARDSSRVAAWGSSRVEARDSSRVVAWGSSRVEARDSSRVVAGKYVAVHLHSARAAVNGGVLIDLTQLDLTGWQDWGDYHGVKVGDGHLTVYKAVGDDLKSPRGFHYPVGEIVEAPDWDPADICGGGLHFSPSPAQARDYHREATRFLECRVAVDDLTVIDGEEIYATPKLKARRAHVVREVDLHGDPITKEG